MTLPEGYHLRTATAEDADVIAAQRAQMFVAMGEMDEAAAQAQVGLWADWLRAAIPAGDYVGFVVYRDAEPAGGVGLMFHSKFPTVQDPATLRVYVLNMYVAPQHRRRGLSEALMGAVLEDTRTRGLRSVSLHAAPMGRPLYERLGFAEGINPHLNLILDGPT
ncbi:GNAT family N-acetyltransferase [Deinococcus navajonensis]|uniref:GNAT family N-acetyltransferase n=1 Tax=Deinococcus navajonensis TaxID=309884 RepID=A0ABV8XRF9_9DEIO